MGLAGSTPSSASTDPLSAGPAGYQTFVSTPLRTTCTWLGSSVEYTRRTSSRIAELTAMTASAPNTAVRSTHVDTR
jgi:hypothetical protein